MGLDAYAKGLSDGFSRSYSVFNMYRDKVAEIAYGEPSSSLYKNDKNLTKEEIEVWNSKCNDDLDIFLWHSDCDGKFTPKECKRIYDAMKGLKIEMQGHNYGTMKQYNMHEHWLNIFKHCYKRRVNLYFT